MYNKQNYDILLVEDNLGDILLTQEAFKRSQVSVDIHSVMDGEQAIDYLNREGEFVTATVPDLVLLDLNLPKKNGKEVLKFIKTDDKLKTIPVIILSTSTSRCDVQKVYELAANSYVNKPVDFNAFINVVQIIENFWLKIALLPTTI